MKSLADEFKELREKFESTSSMLQAAYIVIIPLSALCMAVVSMNLLGEVWFKKESFTATVTRIEYRNETGGLHSGNTRATIRFDNGAVYDLYEHPGLKEGHKYTLEYRVPYLSIPEPYLVVVSN